LVAIDRWFYGHDAGPGELAGLACASRRREPAVVWALLDEPDAEAVRAEVSAGHHRDACVLLISRAVELIPLAAATAIPARQAP
jgi:hypothetical protein